MSNTPATPRTRVDAETPDTPCDIMQSTSSESGFSTPKVNNSICPFATPHSLNEPMLLQETFSNLLQVLPEEQRTTFSPCISWLAALRPKHIDTSDPSLYMPPVYTRSAEQRKQIEIDSFFESASLPSPINLQSSLHKNTSRFTNSQGIDDEPNHLSVRENFTSSRFDCSDLENNSSSSSSSSFSRRKLFQENGMEDGCLSGPEEDEDATMNHSFSEMNALSSPTGFFATGSLSDVFEGDFPDGQIPSGECLLALSPIKRAPCTSCETPSRRRSERRASLLMDISRQSGASDMSFS